MTGPALPGGPLRVRKRSIRNALALGFSVRHYLLGIRPDGHCPRYAARYFPHATASATATAREIEVILIIARAHRLEMPSARVPTFSAFIAIAGAVAIFRPAAREIE